MDTSNLQDAELLSDALDDLRSELPEISETPAPPVSDAILTTAELDALLGDDPLPF